MTVEELNRDQLVELKEHYLLETRKNVSYEDLAEADDLVSDHTVYAYYAGTEFSPDDFSSSKDEDYEYEFSADLSGTPEYIAEQLRLIASDIENGNYGGFAGGYGASWGLERI